MIATKPVEASYLVFVHTDAEADIRDLTGFVHVSAYGSRKPVHAQELGSCESFRFITSPELAPYRPAPAADGSQNNPLNTDTGRAITNTRGALPGAGGVPGAAARGTSLMARAFGASQPALSAAGQAAQVAAPYAPVAADGVALASAAGADNSQPSAPGPSAMSSASVPSTSQQRPLMQAAFGDAYAPASPAAASASAPAPGSGNVTRDGNSYSGANVAGDITLNGHTPRGAGQVSTDNMAAGNSLAAGQPRRSLMDMPFDQAGQQSPNLQAPRIANSTNDWAARKQLDNLATGASSILNTTRGGGRDAHRNPSLVAYMQAKQNDQALQQADAAGQTQSLVQRAGLAREGLQQDGANRRSLVSAMLDQEKLGMERETRGYANRAAGQQEQLRGQYLGAKTDEERTRVASQIRAMNGQGSEEAWAHSPGGQVVDPGTNALVPQPGVIYNRRTGQAAQQLRQVAAQPIGESSQAITIRDNPGLSREQKVEALRKLGYS